MSSNQLSNFVLFLLNILAIHWAPSQVLARVRCFSIFDCEKKVRAGSECGVDGFCTNPYHRQGCLPQRLKGHYKIRTCNSEDPPSSIEKGYCVPSTLDYVEVRISSQNWESVFFTCWILQILLSELLDVPVTIETGTNNTNVNFYDLKTRFEYGKGNDWGAFRVTQRVKDCRLVKNSPGHEYEACTHVVPEVWAGHRMILGELLAEQAIEGPNGLGALGSQFWFIRKATARRHPELLSYLSMQGPEGRKKVAQVFKRPTSWSDYCNLVSTDGCQTPDFYAERAPMEGEKDVYYSAGAFKGYFWFTEKNNCTENPSCTGHIVDYPCGWASYVVQQTFHLDLALESNGKQPGSNGFSYGQMVQIWSAAHELDEDVVMLWWRPESLYQQFLGTESEFSAVYFPPPTQECVQSRVTVEERCGDDPVARIGKAVGSCSDEPTVLSKVISTALYEISFDPEKPEALHSPAYETVKNFRISDLEIGTIFDKWFATNNDKWNLDPRDAVCDWVIENMDQMTSFIPRGYPRVVLDNDDVYKDPIFHAALAFGSLALACSVVATLVTARQRQKSVMRYSQIEFLFLLLFGLMLVSTGSIMKARPPTDSLCVGIIWVINIGYTLELVPLVVKVAAINRLMVASQQMRRVELRKSSLFGAVIFVCVLVGATLAVWTATDPPRKEGIVELTTSKTEYGETIVDRTYFCSSGEDFWDYLGVSWQLLLLLCASVLAFQTRKLREDLNETKELALMIYSHFVFVVLRAITYLVDGNLSDADLEAARSFIFSLDTLATVVIYFVPKFLKDDSTNKTGVPGSGGSIALPVHIWRSKHGSAASAIQHDSIGNGSSQRESSIDYQTNNEWEDPGESHLEQISEEEGYDVSSLDGEESDSKIRHKG